MAVRRQGDHRVEASCTGELVHLRPCFVPSGHRLLARFEGLVQFLGNFFFFKIVVIVLVVCLVLFIPVIFSIPLVVPILSGVSLTAFGLGTMSCSSGVPALWFVVSSEQLLQGIMNSFWREFASANRSDVGLLPLRDSRAAEHDPTCDELGDDNSNVTKSGADLSLPDLVLVQRLVVSPGEFLKVLRAACWGLHRVLVLVQLVQCAQDGAEASSGLHQSKVQVLGGVPRLCGQALQQSKRSFCNAVCSSSFTQALEQRESSPVISVGCWPTVKVNGHCSRKSSIKSSLIRLMNLCNCQGHRRRIPLTCFC